MPKVLVGFGMTCVVTFLMVHWYATALFRTVTLYDFPEGNWVSKNNIMNLTASRQLFYARSMAIEHMPSYQHRGGLQ